MKHVIIGMAGHVDHGKTELVKALTGVDTDRLAEEKKRGITIDLGFARLDFPDGSCASIVDVPGHERFIKNMLAGAGGVDLAMLVVAADEGFMPQTVEHLDILQLLGVKDGLIVLTKTDLVDEDWLNMLEEDVKSRVKGTFLEDKPILRTSVRTGEGIEALREALHDSTLHAEEKSARTPFRLPIDRVFSVDGFGTIVTGTLIDGHIAVGDEAQLMPLGNQCRVRNLQVHGRDVSAVYAGQRAAVNLAGIKKESISRGDVLCRTDSMQPSLMLDVKLQNLPDSKRIIESGSRLHLYHGAAVRLAKAVLLDRDALRPGGSCHKRPTSPACFVLRASCRQPSAGISDTNRSFPFQRAAPPLSPMRMISSSRSGNIVSSVYRGRPLAAANKMPCPASARMVSVNFGGSWLYSSRRVASMSDAIRRMRSIAVSSLIRCS